MNQSIFWYMPWASLVHSCTAFLFSRRYPYVGSVCLPRHMPNINKLQHMKSNNSKYLWVMWYLFQFSLEIGWLTSLLTPHILDANCYIQKAICKTVSFLGRLLQQSLCPDQYKLFFPPTIYIYVFAESKVKPKSDSLFMCARIANPANSDLLVYRQFQHLSWLMSQKQIQIDHTDRFLAIFI